MTAQLDDRFLYKGTCYSVAGISEGELFDPEILSLKPESSCTACWRGFVVQYGIANSRLVVDELEINLFEECDEPFRDTVGPQINGASPAMQKDEFSMFNNHYFGLEYHLDYTGGLLLADGFISGLYVHMGFHPAWKYRRVVELIFENGVLTKSTDRSAAMETLRRRILTGENHMIDKHGNPTLSLAEFIEKAFDRSYRM